MSTENKTQDLKDYVLRTYVLLTSRSGTKLCGSSWSNEL